jgi:hypothetical protein
MKIALAERCSSRLYGESVRIRLLVDRDPDPSTHDLRFCARRSAQDLSDLSGPIGLIGDRTAPTRDALGAPQSCASNFLPV